MHRIEGDVHVGTLHQADAVLAAQGATEPYGQLEDLADGLGQFPVPERLNAGN